MYSQDETDMVSSMHPFLICTTASVFHPHHILVVPM